MPQHQAPEALADRVMSLMRPFPHFFIEVQTMDYLTPAIQLIGSVGFPIIMCLLMYDRMNKTDERHSADINKMTEAVNNNTIAIRELTSKMESDT